MTPFADRLPRVSTSGGIWGFEPHHLQERHPPVDLKHLDQRELGTNAISTPSGFVTQTCAWIGSAKHGDYSRPCPDVAPAPHQMPDGVYGAITAGT